MQNIHLIVIILRFENSIFSNSCYIFMFSYELQRVKRVGKNTYLKDKIEGVGCQLEDVWQVVDTRDDDEKLLQIVQITALELDVTMKGTLTIWEK